MADRTTTLTFIAKDSASHAIHGIKDSLHGLSGAAHGIGGALGGVAVGLAKMGAVAAIAGVAALAGGMVMAVKAAAEEEVGIKKLDAALKANVASYSGDIAAIEKTIRAREKLAFTDDELRDSMGALIVGTKDVAKAQDLQAIAMDLARAKGIDLVTASEMLVKVQAGSYRALKSLGIELKPVTTAQDALKSSTDGYTAAQMAAAKETDAAATKLAAFAAIEAATAGQSEAYAKTTVGAFAAFQIAINDVVEDIGSALLPAATNLAIMFTNEIVPALEAVAGKFKEWVAANQPLIDQISVFISTTLAGLVTFILGTVVPAVTGLAAQFADFAMKIVQDIGPSLAGFIEKFRGFVELILTKVIPTILDLATRVWEGGLNKAVAAAYKLIGAVIDVIVALVSEITKNEDAMNVLRTAADLIGAAFGIVADVISVVIDGIGQLADAIAANEAIMGGLAALGEIIGEAFRIAGEAIASLSGILDDLVIAVKAAIDAIAAVPGVELIADIIGNVGKVIAGEAKTSGKKTGEAYAAGLKSSSETITSATRAALGGSARMLRASSPPGPESPLHEIDVWGENTGKSFGQGLAAGIMAGIPLVKGALGQMAATVTASLEDITKQALAGMADWASGMSEGALRRAEASGEDTRRYFESLVASGSYQWDIPASGGLRVSPTGTSSIDTLVPGAPPPDSTSSGAPVVIKLTMDGREIAEVVDRNLFYRMKLGTTG